MTDENPRVAAARLIANQPGFALATMNADGTPISSYMPFAIVGGAFGIVASRLAAHTANLLAQRPASLLLVDAIDEHNARPDAFARARFSIVAAAVPRRRGSPEADALWSALEARHDATAPLLRTLPDFEAISLVPASGRLILGFASAHDFDAAAIVEAMRK